MGEKCYIHTRCKAPTRLLACNTHTYTRERESTDIRRGINSACCVAAAEHHPNHSRSANMFGFNIHF